MLRTELHQVANGRRLAARKVVINTLASIPCQVWRKNVHTADVQSPDPQATELTWDSVKLSDVEEPDYDYQELGYAYILIDKFVASWVHENNSLVGNMDIPIVAQVEPYDPLLDGMDRIVNVPTWQPKQGDLYALLIDEKLIIWLEMVEISGQTLMSDFGVKYVFNRRDDLTHIEPFADEFEQREI